MPRPTPLSSRDSEAAAAFEFGELTIAKPRLWPRMPSPTATADALAANAEIANRESPITTSPARTSVLGPNLSESLPVTGERTATTSAPGARTSPMLVAESPFTSESINGTSTRLPTLANIMKNPVTDAARNALFLKRCGVTNGSDPDRIPPAKRAARTPAATKEPQETGDENPTTCPCVTPKSASPAE